MKDIKKGTLLGIGFTAGVAILSFGIIVNRNNQQKEELKNNLESDVQSALQYAETWWKNNEYQFGEEEEVEKTIQDLINENYIETDGIVDECGLDDKKNENGQCYGITNELNSKSINNLKLKIYTKNNEVYSCIINDDYNNEILGNDFDYSSLYCKDEDNNSDNQTNEENDNSDIDNDDSKNEEIKYGDVNNDNKITAVDSGMVERHINNISKLTGSALKNADINEDGKVDQTDVYLLRAVTGKVYEHDLSKPLKNYVIYGDANNDGKITVLDTNLVNRHVTRESKLTGQGLKNADVNGDKKVDATDVLLLKAITSKIYTHNLITPLKNYVIYGDANSDGKVTTLDSNLVSRHVSGESKLTGQLLKNADVNGDGKVDVADGELIKAIATKIYTHNLITPLKNYAVYGDVNNDNKITIVDANIVNRHITNLALLEGQKLKNADVNGDNKVDATDVLLIKAISSKIYTHNSVTPLKDYIIYGDANSDGKITTLDSNLVNRHVTGESKLAGQGLKNADVNGDKKVDATDVYLLKAIASQVYEHDLITPLKDYEDEPVEENPTEKPIEEESIKYGDVNNDNKINVVDSGMVERHINNISKLTGSALKNADINEDGKVDTTDVYLLRAVIGKVYEHDLSKPLKNYIIYGDANSDGKITILDSNLVNRHVTGESKLTGQALKNADVNGDKKVDATDVYLLKSIATKIYTHNLISPLTNYAIYGDVNCDGKVDNDDIDYLMKHLTDYEGYELTEKGKINADAYKDNKINNKDLTAIYGYLNNQERYKTLPYLPVE